MNQVHKSTETPLPSATFGSCGTSRRAFLMAYMTSARSQMGPVRISNCQPPYRITQHGRSDLPHMIKPIPVKSSFTTSSNTVKLNCMFSRSSAFLRWVCLSFSIIQSCHSLSAATSQPNIILLLADDLGSGELGFQGNPQIPTPHIDSIANNGIKFTQAYVTAPNCSPSRAGLLTGRIPTRFGYEFNPIGARNEDPGTGLPQKETTMAEWLHDQGYTTGLIGKWHLGGAADYHPMRHGFDEFFGFTHEGHYFLPPPWKEATTMLRRKTLPGGKKGFFDTFSGLSVLGYVVFQQQSTAW